MNSLNGRNQKIWVIACFPLTNQVRSTKDSQSIHVNTGMKDYQCLLTTSLSYSLFFFRVMLYMNRWPQSIDEAISLTTRVSQTFEELEDNCTLFDPDCKWIQSETNISFLTDPEGYTVSSSLQLCCSMGLSSTVHFVQLMLDHSFIAPNINISDNAVNVCHLWLGVSSDATITFI